MPRIWFKTNEEYYEAVLKGIRMSWERLQKCYASPDYWKPQQDEYNAVYHARADMRCEVDDCRSFLIWLFRVRQRIQTGVHPEMQTRHRESRGYLIIDHWDWEDPFADHMSSLFSDYLEEDEDFSLKQPPPPEPEIEKIASQFEEWKKKYQTEEAADFQVELQRRRDYCAKHNWRVMPHLPDPKSMINQRDSALEYSKDNNSVERYMRAIGERDYTWLQRFATYCFIEGYTDYLLNEPLSVVAAHLRQGCEYANLAIEHGFEPHAWYVNDYLHEAIAVNHGLLAQRLVNLRQEDWDTGRIRPVNWLVTQLKLVMEMFSGNEQYLAGLIETNRRGLFEEQLPSELEPDLPMMRNMYHLLRALVERDETAFNTRLSERMPLREAHFTRGGTIAPIALIDVHALALCRLARQRGMKPAADHVYLPMQLLDI